MSGPTFCFLLCNYSTCPLNKVVPSNSRASQRNLASTYRFFLSQNHVGYYDICVHYITELFVLHLPLPEIEGKKTYFFSVHPDIGAGIYLYLQSR
jgi:hypothetical protein